MVRKLQLVVLLVLISTHIAVAQAKKTALVKGKVMNKATTAVAADVQVSIPYLKQLVSTDAAGDFELSQVPYGKQMIIVGGRTMKPDTLNVDINSEILDLGVLQLFPNEAAISMQSIDIPTIALEDNNVSTQDDGFASQNISGLLTASRDPFLNTAAFVWGPYRFQPRGYDRNQQDVQINGAPLNDIETGDAYWSQWGGLNDVFRSRSNIYGLQASDYAFGGINGIVYFDATAANQRKQTRVTYSRTNRLYRNRLMLTHSSGLLKSGWAYSLSASKRWSQEGYVPGTFYDGYSYYAAISKVIGTKHSFNLTTFGAPTRRGKSAPVVQEAYDLAGSNFYNPNWGFQNGEKRNSKVADYFQPTTLFNYTYTPSNRTRWNTAIGYQFGKNKNSLIDWNNGTNPSPVYYRFLPSWQYELFSNDPAQAASEAADVANDFKNNTSVSQLNWDRLYQVNRTNIETVENVNGVAGSNVTGNRSVYVLGQDVDDIKKYIINSNLQHGLSEHVTIYSGISFLTQRTESYRELQDLLGGDFYVNYNQFAQRTYVGNNDLRQNDLNNPNRVVKTGERYYYNYYSRFTKANAWAQATFTFNKVDFFAAASYGFNNFSRDGLYKNGLYPNGSFGKSTQQRFTTYAVKGGGTYKINGRHYIFLNGSYVQDAPTFDNTYVSPRTRNQVVDKPQEQHSMLLEGGYLLHAPKLNARVVGYVTDIKDATDIKRFYNDAPAFQSFVNYALTNINTRYTGLELALDVKVSSALNITGVAAVGQAFYTNRPDVSIYRDNDTVTTAVNRVTYLQNYYLAVGPQTNYSLGLNYRSPFYWYGSLTANYFDRNYVDVNPDRRTANAAEGIVRDSKEWNAIFAQEKLPSAFTLDLFFGKSFKLNKFNNKIPQSAFIYLNVGINNLLDNTNIRTGGFEQLRYDFTTSNPNRFPPKYFYGFGRNFFVNLSLKF